MPIYETDENVEQQERLLYSLSDFLNKMPFMDGRIRLVETIRNDMCYWDADVYVHGLRYGVVEVKCRSYDKEFFIREGFVVDSDKLNLLYQKCHKLGFPVVLAFGTSDDHAAYIQMRDLLMHLPDLKKTVKGRPLPANTGAIPTRKGLSSPPIW